MTNINPPPVQVIAPEGFEGTQFGFDDQQRSAGAVAINLASMAQPPAQTVQPENA